MGVAACSMMALLTAAGAASVRKAPLQAVEAASITMVLLEGLLAVTAAAVALQLLLSPRRSLLERPRAAAHQVTPLWLRSMPAASAAAEAAVGHRAR